jgi:phage anti-repressor protein
VTDYWLNLDSAKHIAMMEKNEQGFAARTYFIEADHLLI